jgi:hypothetical protein
MRRVRILAAALLMVVPLAQGAGQPKPVMALSTERWDFGTLEQGQTASTNILVTNKGDADLKITFIRSSCAACVGNVTGARLVEPGQKGPITLTFYSKGLTGRQSKVVYVHSNDPITPFKAIRIVGVVKKSARPEIHVATDTLDLGLVRKGGNVVRTLAIANKGQAPLRLVGVTASDACRVQFPDKAEVPPGNTAKLRITLLGDKIDGLILEHLTVQTNDPITPSKTVTVVGYAAASAAAARGILIAPVGKPVRVPGSRAIFHRSYRIANGLPVRIHLRFTCGRRDPQVLELSPSEAGTVTVPASALDTEGLTEGSLRFAVTLPALLPAQ